MIPYIRPRLTFCLPISPFAQLAVAGFATIMAALPAAAEPPKSVKDLSGRVYEGALSANVLPPRGSGIQRTWSHGGGTFVLEPGEGDTVNFILNGTLQQDGDAAFFAPGKFVGDKWAGSSDTFQLAVIPGRHITGEGIFDGKETTFDGTFRNNDLELLVEMTVPEETKGGFPAGTLFQFHYKLRYFEPRNHAGDASAGNGDCKEIVYRLKLTPNLFGSGLGSVRVPECVR